MSQIHDIHPHIISADERRYPHSPIGGVQSDWSKKHKVEIDDMIAAMDEAGIASSALVQSATCYGFDNSLILDALARHPDRFTAVASIDMLAPDAVEVFGKLVDRGISGLRIYTGGSKLAFDYSALDDPRSFPVWERAGERDIPVCLQVRVGAFTVVNKLAKLFPGTRILIDHMGRPDMSDGPPYANAAPLFELADHGNIFLKATPPSFSPHETGDGSPGTFFPTLVSEFGADRIAFGSNYPSAAGPLRRIVETAKEGLSSLRESERKWILGGTAERLYPKLVQKVEQPSW